MAEKRQESSFASEDEELAAERERRKARRERVKAANASLGTAMQRRATAPRPPDPPPPVREGVSAAKKDLRRFRRLGDVASEGTTPERLARAGADAKVETFSATVEVFRNNRVETDTVERHRQRMEDSPLERLKSRKLLDPDVTVNAALYAAGDRLRTLFHQAGLTGVRAIDPSRPCVGGSGSGGLLRTDRQLAAFQAYSKALAAIPDQCRPVVEAIVLFERETVDVGRGLTGYADEKQCRAVALYELRVGLKLLMAQFGL